MKTVFIFDIAYKGEIRFFVMEGDHSKFDGVNINDGSELCLELRDLLYRTGAYEDALEFNFEFVDEFPAREVVNGARVSVISSL